MNKTKKSSARDMRGAVLLEVVLALGLFVAGATIALGGLSTATDTVDRLRRELTAVNLASSLIAEVQLGVRPLQSGRPEAFAPPLSDWSWSLTVEPLAPTVEARVENAADTVVSGVVRVEAIVRRGDYAYRLTQFVVDGSPSTGPEDGAPSVSSSSGEADR